MSERDELTEIIGWTFQHAGSDTFKDCADAVLAAGYHKPRTITTIEELEALPEGSVLIQEGVRPRGAGACVVIYSAGLVSDRFGIHFSAEALDELGPLTLLYIPKEAS